MEIKLKPCPFCGGEATLRKVFGTGYTKVSCNHKKDCPLYGANLFHYDKEEGAARVWNHRHTPPNAPLTLDELRQMEGEPVWLKQANYQGYMLINDVLSDRIWGIDRFGDEDAYWLDEYGKSWLAYRHRPGEVEK